MAKRADASPESPLSVEVSEAGPVVREVRVTLPAARVKRVVDRAYRDLGRRVRVKGFRPGKAPRSVLEKYYGASMAEEIQHLLVAESLPEALEQAELEPLSEPGIEAGTPAADEPFAYTARVEVRPEIELPELAGLPARRPPSDVSEEDVERELEALRQRQATLVELAEDARAEPGHVLRIDFVGRIDGEPFEGGSGRDMQVELGSERLVPGFEEQLEGARAGEDREVRVTFPEDYASEALRGKQAVFQVHVGSIQRREVPALDDELAKDLGDFDTLDALRARVREDLEASRERAARSALRRSVMDALIERTSFEVPPGLVERQHRAQLQRLHRELGGQVPEDFLHAQLARMQEEGRPASERAVRESLLLDAVVAAEGIQVSDDDLNARLDELAAAQDMPAREMRRLARERGFAEALREELSHERALDALLARAKVEETSDT